MPLAQIIHVYYLLKAANTEVKGNFRKSIIKVEGNTLWVLAEKQ